MIHALVADSRGHKTSKNFHSTTALNDWVAGQKRTHRGLVITSALSSERPSVRVLEMRAEKCGLTISRTNDRWGWVLKDDSMTGFMTRPDALRAAYAEGVLGE
jgi:hypothetical protein